MDGIMPLKTSNRFIAATNRPDIVDSSRIKARQIRSAQVYVPEPDEAASIEIFRLIYEEHASLK